MSFPSPVACLLTVALFLGPVAAEAQRLGARTADPETHLGALGGDDMAALVAAADAHPLGSVQNPVRVGGPDGQEAYLARLRCADGATPRVGNRADAGPGGFGSVVQSFEVTCGAAAAAPGAARVHLDMYHAEHVETRAPAGFGLTR